MDQQRFLNVLKAVATKETSADPEAWSENNPLWGHCAVASLLAQDEFGGEVVRGSLAENATYYHIRSHYWNRLPNNEEVDFTAEQYPDLSFRDLVGEVRARDRVLAHIDTVRRYSLLKQRFDDQTQG